MNALFDSLKQLSNLKSALKSAAVPSEKIRLNGEIKKTIEMLMHNYELRITH